jgi:hypothetical protein
MQLLQRAEAAIGDQSYGVACDGKLLVGENQTKSTLFAMRRHLPRFLLRQRRRGVFYWPDRHGTAATV